MSLDAAPLGATLRITRVSPGGHLPHRLMEMGLIEGRQVRVVGRAPLGDPMHLRLGDYELSLRASEAALIDVAAT
jgi:ferrous iron transport protein A